MKKIFITLFIFLFLIGSNTYENQFCLLDYFQGEYSVYTNYNPGENSLTTGNLFISGNRLDTEIEGESMIIRNYEPSNAIKILNAKVKKTEFLETGASVIYAYSSKIDESIDLDCGKVNVQIACYDDYFVIGWPLILGSF